MKDNPANIKFIGTAGIYDYELGNSAAIVRLGDKKILVDCGYTIFAGLCKKELIDEIEEKIKSIKEFDEIIRSEAGCVISNHCGPVCVGILFYRK